MRSGIGLLVLLLSVTPTAAGDRPRPDPFVLASAIDRQIDTKLHAQRVAAAPRADDAAFFRRINLALAGRIPVPSEVRAFLADTSADKRARAVDRLLASAACANHLTTSWRRWLLPEAATNPDVANNAPAFEAWLHARISARTPLDQLAAELLTYPLDGRQAAGRVRVESEAAANGPLAFYLAKDARPENLAAATARVFLGVHLECAQCHNHPFARWSRDQFWGVAAFFGGVERPEGGGLREVPGRRELVIPNSDRAVPATFLDDREPEWQYKKSPRATLAAWMTAPDNPFFARALANRLWWFLFGVGLVDPVDDFHDQNPPSHPELLELLARALVDSGFDAQFLLRAICLSETFGRSSAVTDRERQDVRLFAHFPVQALSPEQLLDSLAVILGNPPEGPGGAALARGDTPRRQFLETFAASGRPTDAPSTILQALTLMNGDLVGGATGTKTGRALGAVVALPGLTPAERVEALYFVALARPPRPRELTAALRHVEATGADAAAGYGDVLWALLNGVEFRTNH